jgi:integrase
MAKRTKGRIYARTQGGAVRYYGDFRDFADVGGKREALIPRGAERATSDEKLALALVADRLADLESRRRRKQRNEPEESVTLASYAAYHLTAKARSGRVTPEWLETAQMHLTTAVEFFCNGGRPLPRDAKGRPVLSGISDRELDSIDVAEMGLYVDWLTRRPSRKAAGLSPSSQRKYLNSLSNLYRRAISERRVAIGHNPVSALMDKPQDGAGRKEANWLEVHEAALLLESARLYAPKKAYLAMPYLHALLATLLLTGGRPMEVLGLEVGDVSLERKTIRFRPNARRRLKTAGSRRTVPLWPQLEEILRDYLVTRRGRPVDLLFPSVRTGEMVTDLRKAIDRVAEQAGWKSGEIRPYAFRHTFTAARLQTLDRGQPVSAYTVAKELGHGGDALIKRVYGHLGEVRHRSERVEFRVEDWVDLLSDRLAAMRERIAHGAAGDAKPKRRRAARTAKVALEV